MAGEENPSAKLRLSAMNSLARREHSRAELEKKLEHKFPEVKSLVPDVLDRLAGQGLQSDERYVASLCRSRIAKGHGYARIVNELRQKGISEPVADAALRSSDVDWFELARAVASHRFGETATRDPREIARRMRFLRYRGFSHEQVRYALESLGSDEQ